MRFLCAFFMAVSIQGMRFLMMAFAAAFLFTASCFSGAQAKARRLLSQGRCAEAARAVSSLALSKPHLKFLRRAANVCSSKKKWQGALFFYEALLREERDPKKAREIQKALSVIAAEKLKRCGIALRHYEDLSRAAASSSEKFLIGYQKAECFLKTGKREQALYEIDAALALPAVSSKQRVQAVLMKARLLTSLSRYSQALIFLQKSALDYPSKQAVFRRLMAFVYERRRNLPASLRELERIRPLTPFLKRKMRSLKERIEAAPAPKPSPSRSAPAAQA